MRKVEIKLYQIDELKESAKGKAYERWLNDWEYGWHSFNEKTLKRFEELMGVTVSSWQYDYSYQFTLDIPTEVIAMFGERLCKHLLKKVEGVFTSPRIFEKNGKRRASKVLAEDNGWLLTGYCMDEEILEPLRKFLRKPDSDTTFYDLMYECLDNFFKACSEDYDSTSSLEYFEDLCRADGYEFLENGEKATIGI